MTFLNVIDNWRYRRSTRLSTDSPPDSLFLDVHKRRKAKTTILDPPSFEDSWFEDLEKVTHCLSLDGPTDPFTERKRTPVASTFPTHKCRPRTPALRRPSLLAFDTSSSTNTSSSSRSPDRFIPIRGPNLDQSTQSFRTNKDPQTLSPEERLLRNHVASSDAFDPRRRASSPVPQAVRPLVQRSFSANRAGGGASVLTFRRDLADANGIRQVSVGTVWAVGGLAPVASTAVSDGRGGLLTSGTNAPLYASRFTALRPKTKEELDNHERRIAEALEMDRTTRVLDFRDHTLSSQTPTMTGRLGIDEPEKKSVWTGSGWEFGSPEHILDAPNLRDDFYCSVLAYSVTCHTLAVGLGSLLYAWSEIAGVHLLNGGTLNGSWLTSLAFSSSQGGKSILSSGRSDGSLNLMSLYDSMLPRFELQQPCPIACLKWRPVVIMRPSRNPLTPGMLITTEELAVGDEIGNVYYYSVEWPDQRELAGDGWSGSMTLLARMSIHTQQICGLAFSFDGAMFATGGNDNLCCLFKTRDVLDSTRSNPYHEEVFIGADGARRIHTISNRGQVKEIKSGAEKHRWVHGAAVKAIAFCPWRSGLVATGGGSNDKCIHFYHTTSGACLATISVAAQVTSLIWSTTRREICATFGYAQPEHPYRIAVFSWPECKQIAAIAWEDEHRALYAIAYPGGPNESHTSREGGRGLTRTAKEGCIVVASSDESVKFHEVWTASQKATAGGEGLLGGSAILEGLEGIDKEGEVIR